MRSKIRVALGALDSILNIFPPSGRVPADASHQKRDEAISELHEKPGQTEDYNLQNCLDANLSHCKKAGHTSNGSRRNRKRARGRKADRDEQAVGPGRRPLERSRSPTSYLLIFVCLLSAPFILTLIFMKLIVGYHPSV